MTTRPWKLLGLTAVIAVAGAMLGLSGTSVLANQGYATPGKIGLMPAVTEVAHSIHSFYDLVNVIIIAITIFVLALLIYVMVRFASRRTRFLQGPRTTRCSKWPGRWCRSLFWLRSRCRPSSC